MMFCLLYGIGSMGAKKSLEREIPEGETFSERGQKRLFPAAPERMRKSSYYTYILLKNMREGFNHRARVTGRQIRPFRVFACRRNFILVWSAREYLSMPLALKALPRLWKMENREEAKEDSIPLSSPLLVLITTVEGKPK